MEHYLNLCYKVILYYKILSKSTRKININYSTNLK